MKAERSAKVVFALEPKQAYSAEVGLVYQDSGKSKAIIKLIPTLIVRTPSVELVTISGSGDYREGKSLKASLDVNVHKLLTKPINIKCEFSCYLNAFSW